MICTSCGKKNHYKAKYCRKCGYNFSELERDKAYKKSFYYKLDLYDKWCKKFKLDDITGNIFFRIGVIVIIIYLGLINIHSKGTIVSIEKDSNYEIFYNDKNNEYYLIVDEEAKEIALKLYIPNNTENIDINHYNEENELLEQNKYEKGKDIILTTYKSDYFILNSKYDNKKDSNIKVFVYNKDMVENINN